MSVFISDLLSANILDSYKIVAGKGNLNREVESISLLETPDFEKYVKNRALILTTLYPIKSNLPLFKKLIQVLVDRQVAALIVKLKRYVEEIPEDIVRLSETLGLPLITLDYDANLSDISTRILNELTNESLKTISLSSFYLDLVKTLDENPKLETILSFQTRLENMDYWIYSKVQEKIVSTNKKINTIAKEIANHSPTFQKINDQFVYSDEVKLSNQLLYQVVFFSKEDNRSKIYYYAEIIKLMLVFIYQKRQEISLQQNQFLIELVTTSNTPYANNEAFQEKSEIYGWNVKFPLDMILFQIQQSIQFSPFQFNDLKDDLMILFQLKKEDIRFLNLNQRLLFLLNGKEVSNLESKLRTQIHDWEKRYKYIDIKAAYTTQIQTVSDIAADYATLSRGLNFITQRQIRERVFNQQSVKMFSILGKIPEAEIKGYVQLVLNPLLHYEEKHGGDLLETLYMLISKQFNLKKTAEALFIHYNTLRHRLQVLDSLGYGKSKLETTHYDLIFAVYLAKSLM
jgi:PucR family transcriptional regulator, purine catabolism regulatory protein